MAAEEDTYEEGTTSSEFKLTPIQSRVLKALALIPKAEQLSSWYIGSARAYASKSNPDRFAQAAHSLRELIEKLVHNARPMSQGPIGKQAIEELKEKFSALKRMHYDVGGKTWSRLDAGFTDLGEFMELLSRYLEQQPNRRELFSLHVAEVLRRDPLAGVAESQWPNHLCAMLVEAAKALEAVAHHKTSIREADFENARVLVDRAILALAAPYQFQADGVETVHDQREIIRLIELNERSPEEVTRLVVLVGAQSVNRNFAFRKLNSVDLLNAFSEAGFFNLTSGHIVEHDGKVRFYYSEEVSFLKRITLGNELAVADVLSNIEPTSNPLVQRQVFEILGLLPCEAIVPALLPHLQRAVKVASTLISIDTYAAIFSKIIQCDVRHRPLIEPILEALLGCEADINSEKKKQLLSAGQYSSSLEPVYLLDEQDYAEFIDQVVMPAISTDPEWLAKVLMSVWGRVLFHSNFKPELSGEFDVTSFWCPEIGKRDDVNLRENSMFNALAESLRAAYSISPDAARRVGGKLRKGKQMCYARLRHFVYAQSIKRVNQSDVVTEIAAYRDYGKYAYSPEFSRLIREACATYGHGFLGHHLDGILTSIKAAIANEDDNEVDVYRRHLVLGQLAPFEAVLSPEELTYLNDLKALISLDSPETNYSNRPSFGSVKSVSPKDPSEIAALGDEEILNFINSWDSEGDGPNCFVRVTRDALAASYAEFLCQNASRLYFWDTNWKRVKYVEFLESVLRRLYTPKCKHDFPQSLPKFSALTLAVIEKIEPILNAASASPGDRSVADACRACSTVVDCLDEIISSNAIVNNEHDLVLLEMVMTKILDLRDLSGFNTAGKWSNQLVDRDSLNSFRCKMIRSIFKYFFFLKRNNFVGAKSRIDDLICRATNSQTAISIPEASVIAEKFRTVLVELDGVSEGLRSLIFSLENPPMFTFSLRSYLSSYSPHARDLIVMDEVFQTALRNLESGEPLAESYAVDLGSHMFAHVLWSTGCQSLASQNWVRYVAAAGRFGNTRQKLCSRIFHGLYSADIKLPAAVSSRCVYALRVLLDSLQIGELSGIGFLFCAHCIDPRLRFGFLMKYANAEALESHEIGLIIDELVELANLYPQASLICLDRVWGLKRAGKLVHFPKENVIRVIDASIISADLSVATRAKKYAVMLVHTGYLDFDDWRPTWPTF